jgi:hypothetical protein
MEHRGMPYAPAATAPAATNDKATAIPAKPNAEMFRMTGTIKVD